MTTDNAAPTDEPLAPKPAEPIRPKRGRRAIFAAAGVALLAAGAAAGAGAASFARHGGGEMAPLAPVAISAVKDGAVTTVRGKVAEIFGNKFVLQDDTGRALVETGRAGEGGKLVAADEAVTVQGRFEDGFLRAAWIVRADGAAEKVGGFGPGGPKERDRHGHGPKRGEREEGPRRGADAPPPPPAGGAERPGAPL
ncbi:hypothetical protein [Methylopila sp. Yamaguchi]|uniref:hypothetical protein n=1 Tax=Methylopila sp. Yamaguchi TaxID=1437817 RepID=UPI000CAC6DF2|nr:hypothetical protein [Methylopila sp. Yamaguchi]GBD50741.1 transmembrane protein [Methylopila sp. Yamaguchi]